jgi:hypothetical protein
MILGKLPRYKTLLCIPEDISGIIMKAWKRTEGITESAFTLKYCIMIPNSKQLTINSGKLIQKRPSRE